MGGDIWSEWLLHWRFGSDARRMRRVLDFFCDRCGIRCCTTRALPKAKLCSTSGAAMG